MPFPTIRLKRPTWPCPKDSIGEGHGAIPGTKFVYWKAAGPALEAYKDLLPDIKELLKERQGPLPNSDLVWFGIYMVGPSAELALPHIMFASEIRTQRRKAMNIVKRSELLKKHPGMQVGEWAGAPHEGLHTLSADGLGDGGTGDCKAVRAPTRVEMTEKEDGNGYIVSCFFTDLASETPAKATASIFLKIEEEDYCILPAHILYCPSTLRSTASAAPKDEEEEKDEEDEGNGLDYEFGGFLDEEQGSNELATSRGSLSSVASDVTSSLLSMNWRESDSVPTPLDDSDLLQPTELSLPDDDAVSTSTMPIAADVGRPENSWRIPQISGIPIISRDLDFALLRLESFNCARQPDRSISPFSLFTSVREPPTKDEETVLPGEDSAISPTAICRSYTHIQLPYSQSYQEVYSVTLNRQLQLGDSGSAVRRDGPRSALYGHLISSDANQRLAFAIPAIDTIQHLYDHFPGFRRELLPQIRYHADQLKEACAWDLVGPLTPTWLAQNIQVLMDGVVRACAALADLLDGSLTDALVDLRHLHTVSQMIVDALSLLAEVRERSSSLDSAKLASAVNRARLGLAAVSYTVAINRLDFVVSRLANQQLLNFVWGVDLEAAYFAQERSLEIERQYLILFRSDLSRLKRDQIKDFHDLLIGDGVSEDFLNFDRVSTLGTLIADCMARILSSN